VVDPNHGKPAKDRLTVERGLGGLKYSVILDITTPREEEYSATVLHQSEPCDVALLQLLDSNGKPPVTPNFLSFVPEGSIHTGVKIKTMGYPGTGEKRRPPTLTEGLITQFVRTQSGAISKIETDATVHPGNSGGPVVEPAGQLVGIVSLLQFGQGRKNACGVVPAHLIRQFIQGAFQQGRMPEKMDILPFIDLFRNENDIVKLPGCERKADAVVLHRRDDTVRQCTLATDRLTLPTALGRIEVPVDGMAYILVDNGVGTVLMDGGDQLSFPASGLSITVKIDGKTEQVKLTDTTAMAFPLRARPPAPLSGNGAIVQTAEGCRLGLAEIKGDVSIDGTRYPLRDVTLIQSDEKGQRTVSTAKGERLRGALADQPVSARPGWSAKPIQIRLAGTQQATVRPIEWAFVHARGRRLSERLGITDGEYKQIADLLDGPDWQKARPLIEAKSKTSSPTPQAAKQLRLFRAFEVLRTGDVDAAKETFQKFPKDQLIAQGYLRVLERYPDGLFLGEKLSEPDVMWRASTGEARRIVAEADKTLSDADKHADDPPKLDDDTRRALALQKLERELDIADQLEVGIAQSPLVQVLVDEYHYQYKRYVSLVDEHKDAVQEAQGSASRGSFQKHLGDVRRLEAQIEVVRKEVNRIIQRLKSEAAGFILEPPASKSEKSGGQGS
jgi:hypothetical protein